jgi:ATP-binding cassette subfamily F protein 3
MDIKSKDILKQALKSFDGTLIVVSHDRDFLEGLVDKLYEFRDGKVREHLGGVKEFLQRRKLENLQELERNAAVQQKAAEPKNNALREEMKEKSRQDRKKKNRISYLECEIEKLESRMGEIEKVLSAPGANDDIMELTREYLECKRELDAKTDEWGSLIE